MKICPGCHRRYDEAVKFCPHDGTVLPDAADAYVGRRLMDQFDIVARCGEGAMGTVYRARQINMDRLVAVKILRRDLVRDRTVVKRFYREAKAAARLSHPNIITVHLVAETDEGLPYIVMELLEGTDLDSLCKAEAPLEIGRAVHLGVQIAAALSEAHQNDVVHRDLKPANIIVLSKSRPAEVVKVLDFGIAKILEAGVTDESRITKSGAIFGTPYYLSPEQATGGELDRRADLYSLGVILYRLVTGHLPFESGSGLDILVRHVKDPPPPPRLHNATLPVALERVILTALEKDRERRFQSAEAMRAALLAAASEAGVPAAPVAPDPSSPWSVPVPSPAAPAEGKKTVAGFSSGGVVDGAVVRPPSLAEDPLVRAANRLLGGPGGAVLPKPVRESRPTVMGAPTSPVVEPTASALAPRAAACSPPPSGAASKGMIDPGVAATGAAPGNPGIPVTVATPGNPGVAATGAAPGNPAVAAALAAPGAPGAWGAGAEPDLDTDDLPGAARRSLVSAAPAPVPRLRLDARSGQPLGGAPLAPAASAASPAPVSAAPAPVPRPAASTPDGSQAPSGVRAPTPATATPPPDSSPSVVTGQHAAPSASMILAYQRARARGRFITLGAAFMAFVAIAVGIYFVIRDQRDRGGRGAGPAAPASRDGGPAEVLPARRVVDAEAPEPRLAAGMELLRHADKGVGLRLSCEERPRAGRELSLVLDLWVDGRSRPVEASKASLRVAQRGHRPLARVAEPTGVAGRYLFRVTFRRPGPWAGALEIATAGGVAVKAPLRVEVGPRLRKGTSPRTAPSPRGRSAPRPRIAPRPMDDLPRPPPDEGMGGGDMLPEPPRDPPAPPPDPD